MKTNDVNTFAIAIGIAIVLHAVVLLMFRSVKWEGSENFHNVTVYLQNVDILIQADGSSLGVESIANSEVQKNQTADKKRQIYQQYLEDISDCLHAHRFILPKSRDLIGIASVIIKIDHNGTFDSVRLFKSSGTALLDRAAIEAARVCSGKVKRPKSLGLNPLVVFQEVRYQYKL